MYTKVMALCTLMTLTVGPALGAPNALERASERIAQLEPAVVDCGVSPPTCFIERAVDQLDAVFFSALSHPDDVALLEVLMAQVTQRIDDLASWSRGTVTDPVLVRRVRSAQEWASVARLPAASPADVAAKARALLALRDAQRAIQRDQPDSLGDARDALHGAASGAGVSASVRQVVTRFEAQVNAAGSVSPGASATTRRAFCRAGLALLESGAVMLEGLDGTRRRLATACALTLAEPSADVASAEVRSWTRVLLGSGELDDQTLVALAWGLRSLADRHDCDAGLDAVHEVLAAIASGRAPASTSKALGPQCVAIAMVCATDTPGLQDLEKKLRGPRNPEPRPTVKSPAARVPPEAMPSTEVVRLRWVAGDLRSIAARAAVETRPAVTLALVRLGAQLARRALGRCLLLGGGAGSSPATDSGCSASRPEAQALVSAYIDLLRGTAPAASRALVEVAQSLGIPAAGRKAPLSGVRLHVPRGVRRQLGDSQARLVLTGPSDAATALALDGANFTLSRVATASEPAVLYLEPGVYPLVIGGVDSGLPAVPLHVEAGLADRCVEMSRGGETLQLSVVPCKRSAEGPATPTSSLWLSAEGLESLGDDAGATDAGPVRKSLSTPSRERRRGGGSKRASGGAHPL